MMVLDGNILVYAWNRASPQHGRITSWLTELFESEEVVALPWQTVWSSMRIATDRRLFPNPIPVAECLGAMESLLKQPRVIVVEPGPRHLAVLRALVEKYSFRGGNLMDAVFAALAIEQDATLASCDYDFRKIGELKLVNPLES